MQQLIKLKKTLRASPLSQFAEQMRQGKPMTPKSRSLTSEEIAALERQANYSDDWSLLSVEPSFDTSRIRNSIFRGRIHLAHFFGTVLTPGGVSVPTGVYGSTLQDCFIENALVQDTSLLAGVMVAQGAIVQCVGSFVTSGMTSYGMGKFIRVGNETGGRTIPLVPDLGMEIVEAVLLQRNDQDLQNGFNQQIESWCLEVQQTISFVGKGAMLCNTNIVRNCWIGAHARIDGAAKLRNTIVLSSLETPCEIYDGVILEGCSLQNGVKVHSFAQVRSSLVMSHARLGRNALVSQSIIGPACHIEEAEVTCSLVGPLTQMHHHSLLIACLWPQGRGNLGYGANVGSNHTGRLPDQELRPAIGQFFGLGCSIKFPANYSESPFCLIATGVVTQPQRLRFPFSLLASPLHSLPGLPLTANEIHPGWSYGKNSFALARNMYKYQLRSKGCGEDLSFALLSSETARLVLDACHRLQPKQIKEFYTETDISGLGHNYLRESVRQEALEIYKSYLERFAVDAALSTLEANPELLPLVHKELRRLFQGDLLREIWKLVEAPTTFPNLIKRHRTLEKRWAEKVLHGRDKDTERGRAIFDDYDLVHPVDKDFLEWAKSRFEETRKRCNLMLRSLRAFGTEV